MDEIAQLREELTEIISRYQPKIPAHQLIKTISSVLCKQLNIKRASIKWEKKKSPVLRGFGYAPGFPIIDELDDKAKYHCSPQEIAEADCDGDIRHCKNACGKLRLNKTTVSDYQGADRESDIDPDSSMMHL